VAVAQRVDLTNQVLDAIRAEIIEGRVRSGDRLHVGHLAEQFDVSPTPVKQALGRLATEGLVEFRPRGGAYVTSLATRDIDEILEIREMIEQYAAQQALKNGDDADWDQLVALAESLRGRLREDGSIDFEHFAADDMAFHRVLLDLAGNQRLTKLYETLRAYTVVARAHFATRDNTGQQAPGNGALHVYYEHLAIAEALRSGDPDAVRGAISEHLRLVRHFAQSAAATRGN
jgi:DNA-binding GntR family transcriptional regulator